jgi:hypothetical protein
MTDFILQYWPIFITASGGLVWFVRLEGRVNYSEKMILVLDKHKDELHEIKTHVSTISTDVQWIKEGLGKLNTKDNGN